MDRELNIGWDSEFNQNRASVQDFTPEVMKKDMPHPCDSCQLADLCAVELTECKAFRMFNQDGRWIKGEQGKFRRAMKG